MSKTSGAISISFVVPRYGTDVLGGAETATRRLAEALVRHSDTKVEILTTTAISLATWDNHYSPGNDSVNGIATKRFKVDSGRIPNFAEATKRALAHPASLTLGEANEIIRLQGPVSNGLIDAVAESKSDVVVFYPYLYHPTTTGIFATSKTKVLHPAAHLEPMIHLPIFKDVFDRADGLVVQTIAEGRTVEDQFTAAQKPVLIFGPGTMPTSIYQDYEPKDFGLNARPFLLCLGRVDAPKGTTLLADLFAEYKLRNPSNLGLIIAGPIEIHPNPKPDVIITGAVTEEEKRQLLENCVALISPSAFESFSIVLIEAWMNKKPVIVNALCEPTTEQVQRSGGGLVFHGYEDFEAALDILLSNPALSNALGESGYHYAMENYLWEKSIPRYLAFLRRLLT